MGQPSAVQGGGQVLQPGRSALAVLAAQLSRGPAAEQMQLSHGRHLAQGVELPLPPPCSLHPKTEGRLSCRQRNLGSACAPTVCGAEPGTAKDTLRAGRVATAREVEANSTEGRRAGEVWKPRKPLTRSPFSPLCRQIATPQAWGSWRGSGNSPCRHTSQRAARQGLWLQGRLAQRRCGPRRFKYCGKTNQQMELSVILRNRPDTRCRHAARAPG